MRITIANMLDLVYSSSIEVLYLNETICN